MNRLLNLLFIIFFILTAISCSNQSGENKSSSTKETVPQGFVFVKGGTFQSGDIVTDSSRPLVRVNDFEMLDHAVTNKEYKRFTDATGFRVPLHWENGQIPQGKEDYPVIFVNRYDVDEYLKWLSQTDGKIYRLPTTMEFEYASRGGMTDNIYPWGDDDPGSDVNFDNKGDRGFDRWIDYLQPSKSGSPNGYGLFNMAGNVWHLTVNLLDPATVLYKYRIKNVPTLEGSRMGGSWARSKEYLRCGNQSELSSGIRHPDVGFRPVREPEGENWQVHPRKLAVANSKKGSVFLSWALLSDDPAGICFNIYRAESRNHWGFKINDTPLSGRTTFEDNNLTDGKRYHYYIREVNANGDEERFSNWTGITTGVDLPSVVTSFKPVTKTRDLVPVFGDLNGDGALDCVIRLGNGNQEMSQDPGMPVQMEAFSSFGRSLWRKEICFHDHCYGSANNVPFNVWDMDEDGKDDIITRMQVGDSVFVAILDGMTGDVKCKTPWPEMATDNQRSSTRIHLSVGYLDGVHPAVVTQTGLYENEVFVAFDAQLNKLWQFDSFAETNGSGGHKIEMADVDGDGKQEVFNGTTCLNHDGSLRWSIYRQHPDIVSIHDFLPERPGLEVYYVVESNAHAGVYMVDANTGEVIWKINREDDPRWTHGHVGWASDIWDGSPGIECMSNRAGHSDHVQVLFSSTGKILAEPFPRYNPVEWDGNPTRELLIANGTRIAKFDGENVVDIPGVKPNSIPGAGLKMVADLYGDFRDELVLLKKDEDGMYKIIVVTSLQSVDKRFVAPTETLDYRLWLARNMGGGYSSVYFQKLVALSE